MTTSGSYLSGDNPLPTERGDPAVHQIPFAKAFTRIGRAHYGVDWIERLTDRERWLFVRYHSTPADRLFARHGQALGAEIQSARDRAEWQIRQHATVVQWFEDRGLDREPVDACAFESAFSAAFGDAEALKQRQELDVSAQLRPTANSTHKAKSSGTQRDKIAFYAWMNDEKKKHGTYPPRDSGKRARAPWGAWAKEHGIVRQTVANWVKDAGATNPRGPHPKKSAELIRQK